MRTLRLLAPLTLSLALVGCDAWFDASVTDDASSSSSSAESGESSLATIPFTPESTSSAAMEQTPLSSSATAQPSSSAKPAPAAGSYGDYSPSVLANGRTKVLFFHAAWCPICRNADAQLTAWYRTHPFPISVYKVDYDTETELKQRYGVTYQHTYVLVDGDGDPLKILEGPTDAELQGMLQA